MSASDIQNFFFQHEIPCSDKSQRPYYAGKHSTRVLRPPSVFTRFTKSFNKNFPMPFTLYPMVKVDFIQSEIPFRIESGIRSISDGISSRRNDQKNLSGIQLFLARPPEYRKDPSYNQQSARGAIFSIRYREYLIMPVHESAINLPSDTTHFNSRNIRFHFLIII